MSDRAADDRRRHRSGPADSTDPADPADPVGPADPSRRRFLSAVGSGTLAAVAGCGYRPGGGDIRWRTDSPRGLFRADAVGVAGDRLYAVARSQMSYDFDAEVWRDGGRVTAYRASDGSSAWSVDLPSELSTHAVGAGGAAVGFDDAVVRFDRDGRVWRASAGAPVRSVVLADDRVYALTADGTVSALADGERVAGFPVPGLQGGDGDGSTGGGDGPAGGGDESFRTDVYDLLAASTAGVLVGGRRGLTAFDPDGSRRFTREDLLAEAATVTGDDVYVATVDRLVAIDADSGETNWQSDHLGDAPAPAVTGDAVYYVSDDLNVFSRDGRHRWTTDRVTSVGRGSPVAVDDAGVYTVSRDGVNAFDHDGGRRWTVEHEAVEGGPFAVEAGVVLVADGEFVCHVR